MRVTLPMAQKFNYTHYNHHGIRSSLTCDLISMEKLIKVILVILISSVKFVAGPPFAYYNQSYDFHFFETIFYCIAGGMLGVYVFNYFSKPVIHFIEMCKHKLFPNHSKKPKKIFTPHNRRVVKIWKQYGLAGIAFLTPVILSIPIGNIIAAKLVHNKKKVFLYMFISITFWAFAFTGTFELMHATNLHQLKESFFNLLK